MHVVYQGGGSVILCGRFASFGSEEKCSLLKVKHEDI